MTISDDEYRELKRKADAYDDGVEAWAFRHNSASLRSLPDVFRSRDEAVAEIGPFGRVFPVRIVEQSEVAR